MVTQARRAPYARRLPRSVRIERHLARGNTLEARRLQQEQLAAQRHRYAAGSTRRMTRSLPCPR